MMASACFVVPFAGVESTQRVVHKIIQGFLHIPGISENLDPGLRQFLLSGKPHAAGDYMGDAVFQYLVNRYATSAAVGYGVGNSAQMNDLFLVRVYIRQKKKTGLGEMRADIPVHPFILLQNDPDSHNEKLLSCFIPLRRQKDERTAA
jgi:hypothetical protein